VGSFAGLERRQTKLKNQGRGEDRGRLSRMQGGWLTHNPLYRVENVYSEGGDERVLIILSKERERGRIKEAMKKRVGYLYGRGTGGERLSHFSARKRR